MKAEVESLKNQKTNDIETEAKNDENIKQLEQVDCGRECNWFNITVQIVEDKQGVIVEVALHEKLWSRF